MRSLPSHERPSGKQTNKQKQNKKHLTASEIKGSTAQHSKYNKHFIRKQHTKKIESLHPSRPYSYVS